MYLTGNYFYLDSILLSGRFYTDYHVNWYANVTLAHCQAQQTASLEEVEIFIPVVVGVAVVVCFLSCFVGLAVAGGSLGFRIGNLSVCLKLFTLSDGKHSNKNWLEIRYYISIRNIYFVTPKHALERNIHPREQMFIISGLTCVSRFPHQVWFLVDRYERTSRRSWNKQYIS